MTTDVNSLVTRLEAARDAYYNGKPIMTDAVYDALEDELRATDPKHPFLKKIGAVAPVNGAWPKVKHGQAMSSLNKAQTIDDFATWVKSCNAAKTALLVMDKLDGASLSLEYVDGRLVRAVTRGDGSIGEDITRNVRLMQGAVKQVPNFTGFIRGEIVCKKSDFKRHFPGESNPRNTASGTAKRQSGHEKCQYLTVMAYRLLPEGKTIASSHEELTTLQKWGFFTPNFELATGEKRVGEIYQDYVKSKRAGLDYDIDGLVIEVNDHTLREAQGDLNGRPKAAVAFKFPHEQKQTVLRDIVWQVGNSGRITPVAVFDTVNLAGANVTQASLHNISNIRDLCSPLNTSHFAAGDTILVSRRNDVIPYVEALISPNKTGKILTIPTECPSCQSALQRDGEYLVCKSSDCEAQAAGAVKRWVQKVGILHLGDTMIEALIEQGIVEDPADLYTLDEATLSAVEMDGKVIGGNASRIVKQIQAKRTLPLHVFVGSLGIPLIGRSMAKTIIDAGHPSLHALAKTTIAKVASIPGVGQTKADAFVRGYWAKMELIAKLLGVGVQIQKAASGVMNGKSVCMTGFRDKDMETAIEAQGGTVKSSVSKGLTYLVTSDPNSTSGKAQKARDYGTTIIGVDDMWKLLGGRPV